MKEKLYKSTIKTEIGEMILITSDKGLCFLEYTLDKRNTLLQNRIKMHFRNTEIVDRENGLKEMIVDQLKRYFSGKSFNFQKIPLDIRGTEFEHSVWNILKNITFGEYLTYKEVAEKLGKPNASRAVGGASRRNPVSIIIPCHRVVGTSGSLTGYGGGLHNKKWLIDHESLHSNRVTE